MHVFSLLHKFNLIANWARDYRYAKRLTNYLLQSTLSQVKLLQPSTQFISVPAQALPRGVTEAYKTFPAFFHPRLRGVFGRNFTPNLIALPSLSEQLSDVLDQPSLVTSQGALYTYQKASLRPAHDFNYPNAQDQAVLVYIKELYCVFRLLTLHQTLDMLNEDEGSNG